MVTVNGISTTSGHMDETLGYREDLGEALDRHNTCDGVESSPTRWLSSGPSWPPSPPPPEKADTST